MKRHPESGSWEREARRLKCMLALLVLKLMNDYGLAAIFDDAGRVEIMGRGEFEKRYPRKETTVGFLGKEVKHRVAA